MSFRARETHFVVLLLKEMEREGEDDDVDVRPLAAGESAFLCAIM